MQERFERLERVRDQINDQTVEGKHWFQEVLRKLDYLMEKFLLFANKEVQFDQYLHSVQEEVGRMVPPPVAKATDDEEEAPQPKKPPKPQKPPPPPGNVPFEDTWV